MFSLYEIYVFFNPCKFYQFLGSTFY